MQTDKTHKLPGAVLQMPSVSVGQMGFHLIVWSWRNLWRNPRRTWLTISGVAFAVWFLVFARSMQVGTFDLMIDNGARLMFGHLQIQHPNYHEDPSLGYTLQTAKVLRLLKSYPQVEHVSSRAQGYALVSVGERSFGAQVMGVDAQVERQWSSLARLVVRGRYLQGPGEAIVGTVLARNLGIEVGQQVVLLGTAKQGGVAAMAVDVVGIFESGNNAFNRGIMQVHINDFREAWRLTADEAHTVVGIAKSVTASEQVARRAAIDLARVYPTADAATPVRVLDWPTLMPEAQQTRDMKSISTRLFFYVIAVIVGFSVVTTFIMLIYERTQEFGVLLAVGVKSRLIRLQLHLEALMVSVLGLALGVSVAAVLTRLMQINGLPLPVEATELYQQFNMPTRIFPEFDWPALGTATLMAVVGVQVAVFIPGWRIRKLRPVEALRQE